MTRLKNKILICSVIFFWYQLAYALPSDKTKKVYLTSDHAHINYKTGINTFWGHVVVDQGTTHLHGDKMIVTLNQNRKIQKVVTYGNLAEYSTLQKIGEPVFHATAKIITYYPQTTEAFLDGKATTRKGYDQANGEHMTYNDKTQEAHATPKKGGRITMIIDPTQSE